MITLRKWSAMLLLCLSFDLVSLSQAQEQNSEQIPGMNDMMNMMNQMMQVAPMQAAPGTSQSAPNSGQMPMPMPMPGWMLSPSPQQNPFAAPFGSMTNPMAMTNPMMMMGNPMMAAPMGMMSGAMGNPFVPFMTPQNWVNPNAYMAFMNPNTYTAMMNPMSYMAFMNPGTYGQLMNPYSYMAFMNPQTYGPMMNPNVYAQMMMQMLSMFHSNPTTQQNFWDQWMKLGK